MENAENEEVSLVVYSKNKPLRNILKSAITYQCETCNKVYEKKSNLVRHVKTVHSGSHRCEDCGEEFTGPSNLLRHMNQKHREVTHNCVHCNESFTTRAELQSHRKVHKGRPEVYCDRCNEVFLYKKDLKTHIREMHKEIPRRTSDPPVIISDQIITEDGKSAPIFRCNLCTRAFSLKTDLLRHFLVHSGEKPFGCDKCESRFNRRSNLLRHKRSMHNVIERRVPLRYQRSDLRQRMFQDKELWEIESEALAEEERIIREQQLMENQRQGEIKIEEDWTEEQFSDNDELLVIDDGEDQNYNNYSQILIEPDYVPQSGVELASLNPDEKITVRILTFDS